MNFSKTKDIMLEAISDGITDFHKIPRYKRIDLASAYIDESDFDEMDPIISLYRLNMNLLRNFLGVNSEQKLNQLKEELSDAILNENSDALEDIFEQEYANYNDNIYEEVYHDV